MTRFLARLADLSYRRRGRMVLAWIVAAVVIIGVGSSLAGEYNADYNTPGSESKAAANLTEERFGGYSGQEIYVVWKDPAGAQSPAAQERVDQFLARAQKIDHVAKPTAVRVSEDGKIGATTLPLTVPGWDVPKEDGEKLIAAAEANSGNGLQIKLGGDPIYAAQEAASPEGLGFLGAAIVLLIAFGTVVAAGLPLIVALVGLGITSGGLIVLLANVVDVPDWTTAVSGLIGIGVGIDYALLVLTRFRAAMGEGKDTHDAVVEAVTTAGRSVILAGGTVVISVLGLMLTGLPYMYGVAIAASLAVLVVMLASVSLLPALLSYLGPRVDRLRIPLLGRAAKVQVGGESPAARWSHAVQRRPWPAAIAATVVLLLLAAPALGMRLGFPDAGNDPASSMTRQAYDLNTEGFGPGSNGPLVVAAELPGPSAKADIDAFATKLRRDPGVAFVAPPQINPEGNAAIVTVIPKGSPQDAETEELVHRVREEIVPSTLARAGIRGAPRRRDRRARGPEQLHHRPHAAVHRRRRRLVVPAPARGVPLAADLAQGGDHEPALRRRRLRRDDAVREGRHARADHRHRPRGPDRPVHAGDDVRDPVRPLDGLRGVPHLADPRGVPQGPQRPPGRGRRVGQDGARDHCRGRHHGRGLPRLPGGARRVPQAVRHRARVGDLPRRHVGPDGPRARRDAAARRLELVDPGLARADAAEHRRRARRAAAGGGPRLASASAAASAAADDPRHRGLESAASEGTGRFSASRARCSGI